MTSQCLLQSCRSSTGRLPWLQATLADLEDKMTTVILNLPEEDDSDSFAERAENYYRKRPQLLTLLQSLYEGYLSLADRYCQALTKQYYQQPSQISDIPSSDINEDNDDDDGGVHQIHSDVESSLSYQLPPPPNPTHAAPDFDALVTELVTKSIDYDILLHELGILKRCQSKSWRKNELQKSLVEVLESERSILVNENARLGYRVSAMAEENKVLALEAAFMKRKASELARCVLKMRENRRICLLSRKIEDLQEQIYGLEKRNKEYYEQLVRRDERDKKNKKEVALKVCFEVERLKAENERLREEAASTRARQGWRASSPRWWDRVNKLDVFLCGSHNKSTCC